MPRGEPQALVAAAQKGTTLGGGLYRKMEVYANESSQGQGQAQPQPQPQDRLCLTVMDGGAGVTVGRCDVATEWFAACDGCLLQTNPETHASPSCLVAAADPA